MIGKGFKSKEHIKRCAIDLFREQGFHATTIRDIATVSGANISMIKYYYQSKNGLLWELFCDYQKNVKAVCSNFETSVFPDDYFRFVVLTADFIIDNAAEIFVCFEEFGWIKAMSGEDREDVLDPFLSVFRKILLKAESADLLNSRQSTKGTVERLLESAMLYILFKAASPHYKEEYIERDRLKDEFCQMLTFFI